MRFRRRVAQPFASVLPKIDLSVSPQSLLLFAVTSLARIHERKAPQVLAAPLLRLQRLEPQKEKRDFQLPAHKSSQTWPGHPPKRLGCRGRRRCILQLDRTRWSPGRIYERPVEGFLLIGTSPMIFTEPLTVAEPPSIPLSRTECFEFEPISCSRS